MRANRIRVRTLAVAVSVVVLTVLAFAVASAPAGNRDPLSTLEASPGPAEVTLGQNVAVTATLVNRQSSTFTDVRFRLPLPAGVTVTNTTCTDSQVLAGEFSCKWGHQLRAGATATVVLVLRTPTTGSSLNLSGTWSIKEGSQGGNDTFETNPAPVGLITASNAQKAGGFSTTACTTPSGTPTIATNQAVGANNPLTTSVCAPNLPIVPVTGIAASLNERNKQSGEAGVTQISDICLPAPGAACGGAPFHFSTPATFTFKINNASFVLSCSNSVGFMSAAGSQYGGGCTKKITKVFHDDVLVSSSSTADPRVVSITLSSDKKVSTVVVASSENGRWGFG